MADDERPELDYKELREYEKFASNVEHHIQEGEYITALALIEQLPDERARPLYAGLAARMELRMGEERERSEVEVNPKNYDLAEKLINYCAEKSGYFADK